MKRVSQPYAPGATPVWTAYTYDGLGRTLTVPAPDGASTATYVYEGNTTKITDPSVKWKKYVTDAMGNLTKVIEPNPAGGADFITTYTYDALNHLTQVSMPRPTGTQTRTFNYDATTQRLTSTTNPENGTVTYTYNADGTLATRVDAKNQKVVYVYDQYKRVTQIQRHPVSTGPEDVWQRTTFSYDTNPYDGSFTQFSNGRPTAVEWGTVDQNAPLPYRFRQMYSYTPAGLVTKKRLNTTQGISGLPSANLETQQTYDNEGKVITVKYPDAWVQSAVQGGYAQETGMTYTYTYDAMGRPIKLSDNQAIDWAKDLVYGPAGELKEISYRQPPLQVPEVAYYKKETRTYNSRLQMTNLKVENTAPNSGIVGNIDYVYAATTNNGQIIRQKEWVSGEEVEYQYDGLQRLISASTTGTGGWGQTFSYDGFGNLTAQTVTKGTAPNLSVNINPNTNRIIGVGYDANGNMYTSGGLTGAAYDIENRMVSATSAAGTELYAYGPDNKRIYKKKPNGTEEIYFYGIHGQKLGTYRRTTYGAGFIMVVRTDATGDGTNLYFGSKMILSKSTTTPTDRLGSRAAVYPYGEEKQVSAQETEKFATYYRDSTGLDYAQQRYYANTLGRFTSPDPYKASGGPSDPTSWNQYAYTRGDPVNRYDPSGLLDVNFDIPSDGGSGGGGGCIWDPVGGYFCLQMDLKLPPAAPQDPDKASYCFVIDSKKWVPNTSDSCIVTLAVLSQQLPSVRPIYCEPDVIAAMNTAWIQSGIGISGVEAGFRIDGLRLAYRIVPTPFDNQHMAQRVDVIRNVTFAIFHVHPNRGEPRPSEQDMKVGSEYGINMFTMSGNGLWEYDPRTKATIKRRNGLDWLTPCP